MIRNAELTDLPEIQVIYAGARAFMKQTGNPTQWGDTYPSEEMLRDDIANRWLYVYEVDNRIQAVFAFIGGEDPTYGKIEGAWLNDDPYMAVHRVASRGEVRGVTAAVLDWCSKRCSNLRIDTHDDNLPMQNAIRRCGFTYCGRIWYFDGSRRIAFQRIYEEA